VKSQNFGGLLVDLVRSYDETFERSLPSGDPKQRGAVREAVQRALLWVLGAERSLDEAEYLALQTGRTTDVPARKTLKVCQNFFHLSEDGRIAEPHSSVWDYVSLKITHQVDGFIKFAKSENHLDATQESILIEAKKAAASKAHEQIAKDCLELIMNAPGVQMSGATSKQGFKSALHDYACSYWTLHFSVAMSVSDDPTTLIEQGKALFEPGGRDAFYQWVGGYDAYWTMMLPNGFELESRDPLYYAIQTGCADIVRFVLNTTQPSSWTGGPLGKALQLACYQGKTSMVRVILNKIGVDEADDLFGIPLHAAIAGRQKEVSDILVKEYHANVNAPSVWFGNAVQMAVALGDRELLHLLVAHGAQCKSSGGRARIWASVWEQTLEPGWFDPK
jgi:hypothetical protein